MVTMNRERESKDKEEKTGKTNKKIQKEIMREKRMRKLK